ncbi:UNVERIFIED_CONTAM: hypothetical protein GTU68_009382 [Idotea baltica]|nr:hypothetical protein [Idotea baltica]
MERPSGPRKH